MAAATNRPDDEPDDPGFEVVGNSPARPAPRPARPVPARPIAPPPARAVPKKLAEDPGFEVISPPPPRKPKPRVVDDADDTEEAPRARARTRADLRRKDEEDELPRRKRRRASEDETDDDDRPRPRKKKRRKGGVEISDGANNVMLEWGGPVFLMLIGLALGLAGTIGMAVKPNSGISPVLASVLFVVGHLIWIPIEIVGLMLIGKVFGIEYGDITSALRNLAAMGFLVSGLMAVLDWIGLSWFVSNPIIFVTGLGLFIALFRLDVWEAVVTMVCLNIMSFAFYILLVVVVIAMMFAAAKHGGGDFDEDFDDRPGINRGLDPDFDPDDLDDGGDEWDPDAPRPPVNPRGKAKGSGAPGQAKGPAAGGSPKGKSRPRSPVPDDG